MPTLLVRFPGGRYHATPWGHHVNEGLVEWPPCPWRLLRALIACGYAACGWQDVPPAGRRLTDALASTLPTYQLPPASVGHSRHFMPIGVMDRGREKTTLVFDAFAHVGVEPLIVTWNCALDGEAADVFRLLASRLSYLGRSESLVVAEAVDDPSTRPGGPDAYPHVDGHRGGRGWEQVSLMAPDDPEVYAEWRARAVSAALASIAPTVGRKAAASKIEKQRANAEAPYPPDLLACLQKDTAWWKAHRWSQPPGSRRVLYWRRSDALSIAPPVRRPAPSPRKVPFMLLALTTPSGRTAGLPRRIRALAQAELLHRALVARVAGGGRAECLELTGRDAEGRPLSGHRHAHILPVDLGGDGRIDHVLLAAGMGFGPTAQKAVRALERTWTKGGVGELQVALAGHGGPDELRSMPAPLGTAMTAILGPPGGAREWESFTPLVLPRHQKRRGVNTLEGQIASELVSRGLPAASVEVFPWNEATRDLRHAVRVRRFPAKPPPLDMGFAVRLVFERPVNGPIALGYASHFGLGVFVTPEVTGTSGSLPE